MRVWSEDDTTGLGGITMYRDRFFQGRNDLFLFYLNDDYGKQDTGESANVGKTGMYPYCWEYCGVFELPDNGRVTIGVFDYSKTVWPNRAREALLSFLDTMDALPNGT